MHLNQCILTQNDCYLAGRTITPTGVLVHSTGVNNPTLKRYVQPDDGLLGVNAYGNHWNQEMGVCVHGFIGKLTDGSIATYQTLPWNHRAWHCGDNANNTHIAFEICEDGLTDESYFNAVYREAVELTAYLCEMYGMNPLDDGVVICHAEGYERGIASCHDDVTHWWPKFGKTMDDFRQDVAEQLNRDEIGDDDMDIKEIRAELTSCADTGDKPSDWAQEATEYCKKKEIFNGDGEGNYGWQQPITREAVAVIIYNALEGK